MSAGCYDDIELLSVTCTGIACSASADSSAAPPTSVHLNVKATEPGTATLGVRVRHTGSGEEWDDRIDIQFYQPTGVLVVGDQIGGGRAFLPGMRLWFTPSLVAGDHSLQHDFDASQVHIAGGITLDTDTPMAGDWAVITNAPGPASLTFETHGVSNQIAIQVADPDHAVGFELYSSSGSTTRGDTTIDPLVGRQQLSQVVIAPGTYYTWLFPVALLDDGTRALGADGFASVTDPQLSVAHGRSDGQIHLEANRAEPSGNALLTLSHGGASTSFPVLIE